MISSEHIIYIISFNPHVNPVRYMFCLILLLQMDTLRWELLNDLPKVTQLGRLAKPDWVQNEPRLYAQDSEFLHFYWLLLRKETPRQKPQVMAWDSMELYGFESFLACLLSGTWFFHLKKNWIVLGLLKGSDGKESTCSAGDPGLIPGSERSVIEGDGSPLQYSCLENPRDRGTWWPQFMESQRVRHDWVTSPCARVS